MLFLFSVLSNDFAEAMTLVVCSWRWLAFSLHLKRSPEHPSVNSSSVEHGDTPSKHWSQFSPIYPFYSWSSSGSGFLVLPWVFFSLSDPVSRIRGPLFPSQTRAAFCWLGSTQADYIGTKWRHGPGPSSLPLAKASSTRCPWNSARLTFCK